MGGLRVRGWGLGAGVVGLGGDVGGLGDRSLEFALFSGNTHG